MGKVIDWLKRRPLKTWLEAHRADRRMPPPLGRWPGHYQPVTLDVLLPAPWYASLHTAVCWWHAQLGRDLFAVEMVEPWAQDRLDHFGPMLRHVVIKVDHPLLPALGTAAMRVRNGVLERGEIRMKPEARDSPILTRQLAHELGHAMGLGDHDEGADPNLLMDPHGHGWDLLPGEIAHVRRP